MHIIFEKEFPKGQLDKMKINKCLMLIISFPFVLAVFYFQIFEFVKYYIYSTNYYTLLSLFLATFLLMFCLFFNFIIGSILFQKLYCYRSVKVFKTWIREDIKYNIDYKNRKIIFYTDTSHQYLNIADYISKNEISDFALFGCIIKNSNNIF